MSEALLVEHADFAMRNWVDREPGKVPIGSARHLKMFCTMLLETHNPYRPAVINWPKLEPDALARVTSLPIWDMAVQTEGRASARVAAFAAREPDPGLRAALEMDGGEEARHKVVLSKLVEAYGIALEKEPPYAAPKDIEWGWLVTGYSECIDSFFAFGLFELARRSGYFPVELVETFEPVIQEEARHILFFVNWAAWYRRNLPLYRRVWFALRVAGVFAFLIWERIGIARGLDTSEADDANFTLNGSSAIGADLKPRDMLCLCLEENRRRMAGYDERLLRPTLIPRLAAIAVRFMGGRGVKA
jgi:hypothetical protein